MKSFFRIQVPFYLLLLSVAVTVAAVLFFVKPGSIPVDTATTNISTSSAASAVCNLTLPRLNGYNFIKPLLFVESACESDKMNSVKSSLASFLDQQKISGTVSAVSVYLKDMENSDWTGYNADEKHNPGSLMKVPEMITLFKMEEAHPGFLQKKVQMNASMQTTTKRQEMYLSKSIEPNKSYTILELIKYMIAYSDNNATLLLNSQMDPQMFKKTFTDLGLPPVDLAAGDYPVSAKDYSHFLRALYNATYLTIDHSEQAVAIMNTCDFHDGFYKALPDGTKMAHKYGMARYNNDYELSESAIIYINNKTFVLTVMARGKEFEKLPGILQESCRRVYNVITAGS